ncbi:hypothetical protein HYPBUDRAFT_106577 [Hyphopichia burtonii NRRL Y-1933]|uniref:Protein SCD5 n=1 Tax=Hyphopichia burtonii NRRL Y-1933 TaxID=984485 RepID=A0A1E4RL77_9ASCO|nr:hypothetical protein HYPBUDRAFT_106577 [Hyphopichia burtonii NRRL Y-1933]ODV68017.1 hypothetical protein HYPBUDRAFT_106577 [Hyphopichia burtonii NRRL Y-1933]
MNGSGFDWLNIPSSNNSGAGSPAPPPVSFGYSNSNSELSTHSSNNGGSGNNYYFANSLADHLPKSKSYTETNNHSSNNQVSGHSNVQIEDDSSIPLSLTAQELTLEETKTYMRWYSDILAKTNSRTVCMNDVYQFLNNFKLPSESKEKLNRIFHKILNSINIGEFFALLRLVSHVLQGLDPSRRLIKVQAPVPTPPSILSKKRQNDDNDYDDDDDNVQFNTENNQANEKKPLDLDSFTQFMLTGQRPGEVKKKKSKKLKSVKFSDQIVTDIRTSANSPIPSPDPSSQSIDYSLPMDQLLQTLSNSENGGQNNRQSNINRVSSPDEEEKQILRDMESQINHFQNVHSVDTASIDGVPANINLDNTPNQYLKPNMTGPNQMSQHYNSLNDSRQGEPLLKPNMTGPAQMSQYISGNVNEYSSNPDQNDSSPLKPNFTGPIDMAKMFAPSTPDDKGKDQNQPKISLLAFTDQMTGNTMSNTLQNSKVTDEGSPSRSPSYNNNNRPLPPPPVPNMRRTRSISTPTPRVSSPLSSNKLSIPNTSGPPVPPRSPLQSSSPLQEAAEKPTPPPPPPSRRRGAGRSVSPAPPLPPKVTVNSPDQQMPVSNLNNPYSNNEQSRNDSTANILDDLKALQEEVDKIRDLTGGF